jgi:hypothetical protein
MVGGPNFGRFGLGKRKKKNTTLRRPRQQSRHRHHFQRVIAEFPSGDEAKTALMKEINTFFVLLIMADTGI